MARGVGEQLRLAPHHLVEIQQGGDRQVLSAEIHEGFHDVAAVARGLEDDLGEGDRFTPSHRQHLGRRHDGGKDVVDLMGHAPGELAQALEALEVRHLGLQLLLLRLRQLAVRDVLEQEEQVQTSFGAEAGEDRQHPDLSPEACGHADLQLLGLATRQGGFRRSEHPGLPPGGQRPEVPSGHLLRSAADDLTHGRVDLLAPAGACFEDSNTDGCLHHHQVQEGERTRQLLLRLLAEGDVPRHADNPGDLAVGPAEGCLDRLQQHPRAIRVGDPLLHPALLAGGHDGAVLGQH